MPIKHKFVSEVDDTQDESLVRPSDWNDDHEGINIHDHSDEASGGELAHVVIMHQVFN